MKINAAKSKIMIFNKSKKYDIPPEYTFNDGKILEIIEESNRPTMGGKYQIYI